MNGAVTRRPSCRGIDGRAIWTTRATRAIRSASSANSATWTTMSCTGIYAVIIFSVTFAMLTVCISIIAHTTTCVSTSAWNIISARREDVPTSSLPVYSVLKSISRHIKPVFMEDSWERLQPSRLEHWSLSLRWLPEEILEIEEDPLVCSLFN